MTDRENILTTIEDSMERINTVDNHFIEECIGVSQAWGDLRQSLDKIDVCLKKRMFEKAASLGYSDVPSAFVFLQRTLGRLQDAANQKEELVSDIALKSGVRVYEEVAPFVDDALVSSKERSEGEKTANKKTIEQEYKDEQFIEVQIEIEVATLKWFQEHFENWQAAMNAVLVLHCQREKTETPTR